MTGSVSSIYQLHWLISITWLKRIQHWFDPRRAGNLGSLPSRACPHFGTKQSTTLETDHPCFRDVNKDQSTARLRIPPSTRHSNVGPWDEGERRRAQPVHLSALISGVLYFKTGQCVYCICSDFPSCVKLVKDS